MKSLKKINPILIVVGIGAIAVFGLLAEYSGFLVTRAPAPVKVQQGQLFLVSYKTSKNVPAVKIELCRGANNRTCATLASKATGNQALVVIPGSTPVGAAIIKVSERNKSLALNGKVQSQIAISVTKSNISSSLTPSQGQPSIQQPSSSSSGTTTSNSGLTGGGLVVQPTVQPTPFIPPVIPYKLLKVCVKYPEMTADIRWYPDYGNIRYRFPEYSDQWQMPAPQNVQTAITLGRSTTANLPGIRPSSDDPKVKMEIQLLPPNNLFNISKPSQVYTMSVDYANSLYDLSPVRNAPGSICVYNEN